MGGVGGRRRGGRVHDLPRRRAVDHRGRGGDGVCGRVGQAEHHVHVYGGCLRRGGQSLRAVGLRDRHHDRRERPVRPAYGRAAGHLQPLNAVAQECALATNYPRGRRSQPAQLHGGDRRVRHRRRCVRSHGQHLQPDPLVDRARGVDGCQLRGWRNVLQDRSRSRVLVHAGGVRLQDLRRVDEGLRLRGDGDSVTASGLHLDHARSATARHTITTRSSAPPRTPSASAPTLATRPPPATFAPGWASDRPGHHQPLSSWGDSVGNARRVWVPGKACVNSRLVRLTRPRQCRHCGHGIPSTVR